MYLVTKHFRLQQKIFMVSLASGDPQPKNLKSKLLETDKKKKKKNYELEQKQKRKQYLIY